MGLRNKPMAAGAARSRRNRVHQVSSDHLSYQSLPVSVWAQLWISLGIMPPGAMSRQAWARALLLCATLALALHSNTSGCEAAAAPQAPLLLLQKVW